MKIEIWSDIMCPFCYIGKRRLEAALAQFPEKEQIEIEWRSFQLDPDMQRQPGKDLYQYLAERKGMSREQSVQMHEQVTQMAKDAGLDYHFDKAVIANSFDAHRLIQFAKTKGLGDAAEERIFHAYFTEGLDVGDLAVLTTLAEEIGLETADVTAVLNSNAFADAVDADVRESQRIGVRGVPFFVLDRKYGISGAQPAEAFKQAIEQAFGEWKAGDGGRGTVDGRR
jgi:predicted DsbA family dithiol-disulfide isomerase